MSWVSSARQSAEIWVGASGDLDRFLLETESKTILLIDAYLRVLVADGHDGFWQKVWKANIRLLFNEEFVQSRLGTYVIQSLSEDRYSRFNADARSIIGITRDWSRFDGCWTTEAR